MSHDGCTAESANRCLADCLADCLARMGLSPAEQLRAHVALENTPAVGLFMPTKDLLLVIQLVQLALLHPSAGPHCARAGANFIAAVRTGLPDALKKLAGGQAPSGPGPAFDGAAARENEGR